MTILYAKLRQSKEVKFSDLKKATDLYNHYINVSEKAIELDIDEGEI